MLDWTSQENPIPILKYLPARAPWESSMMVSRMAREDLWGHPSRGVNHNGSLYTIALDLLGGKWIGRSDAPWEKNG